MKEGTFNVKFYGTRGSVPVCEAGFQEFGGNTTCIAIRGQREDSLGIIDAGTGLRNLGLDLLKGKAPLPTQIIMGFTHFHWDHIQGFPFFDPFYTSDIHVMIVALGQDRGIDNLKRIFEVQMEREYFPIPLEKMGASFDFLLIDKVSELFNYTQASAIRHNHPGGAYTYKLEQGGKTIIICTDIEHGDELDPNIVAIAKDADLLIHDAQYTKEELKNHKGWGHSSYDQAIEVANLANVKQLILTHHDPAHDDVFLRKMEKYCQERFPNCLLAREGMVVEV